MNYAALAVDAARGGLFYSLQPSILALPVQN